MFDFLESTKNSFANADPFQAFREAPSPQSPEALWHMEQALYKTSSQVADQIVFAHLLSVHQDKDFVSEAIKKARSESSVLLVNKGHKKVSVLLSGGARILLKTPYLRADSGDDWC